MCTSWSPNLFLWLSCFSPTMNGGNFSIFIQLWVSQIPEILHPHERLSRSDIAQWPSASCSFRYATRLTQMVIITTKYYPRSVFLPTMDIWSIQNITAFSSHSLIFCSKHDTSSCPNRFCGSHVNPLNRVSCNRLAIVERILVVIPAETTG